MATAKSCDAQVNMQVIPLAVLRQLRRIFYTGSTVAPGYQWV